MMEIYLPGLRADAPAGALALYGVAELLGEGSRVRWSDGGVGTWHAVCETEIADDVAELAAALATRAEREPAEEITAVAKDLNELTPETFASSLSDSETSIAAVVAALSAEAPLRAEARLPMTPVCVYSFGTRGTLFGSVRKAEQELSSQQIAHVLAGPWTRKRGVNTLGFDAAARRQDGATMGPDPSADGVFGVPGLVPLVIRGLHAVIPMPSPGRRPQGGAFGAVAPGPRRFQWPVFTAPVDCHAIRYVAARDWASRSGAQLRAAAIAAVFSSEVLRDERRLALGRRVR